MAICWISSYPKSGNTWFRAFLTNYLQNCSAPASFNALLGKRWASERRWIDSVLGFDSSLLSFEEFDVLRPAVYAWEGQSAGIQYHKVHEYFRRTAEGKPLFAGPGIYGCIYIARNP